MERETHILVLTFAVQGHINPMLQFSKRLASKGLRVTFVTTTAIGNSMPALPSHSINVEIISDGSGEAVDSESIDAALERYKLHVSQSLPKLIEKHNSSKYPPKFMVYDSGMPWALEIARQFGIDAAPFFTQSCVINAIYYHATHGAIQMPLEEGASIALPSVPPLGVDDLPSFFCDKGLYPSLLKLVLNQFSNFLEANWLFCNTFNDLENEGCVLEKESMNTKAIEARRFLVGISLLSFPRSEACALHMTEMQRVSTGWRHVSREYLGATHRRLQKVLDGTERNPPNPTYTCAVKMVVNWMISQQWPVKTIGPAIPSIYLDKRLEDDKDYGVHLFKPDVDACMKWLDTKETNSVVYTSFGSLASLGEKQMDELTGGLKNINCYFLWVVRETEQKKLPPNFLQETSEKGLVVSWCPQLEVLAHKAIGCFMTHCGWNSTLEALSLVVPMVALPIWTDQPTNAKFIVDVWKVGVRVKLDERGIATKEEIELCIKEVIEGERGKEMKMNSVRWKELAKEAVDEGGSSDKNIEEFVAKLVQS
uniref:Glycosyltransferase n=1 Tax=Quercus lobata TaxID=97700 RepID=A0A7N2MTU4_QUELO